MTTVSPVYSGDNLSPEQRHRAMQAVRERDTSPELMLRAALRKLGLIGYRLDRRDLPGRPDIVFPKQKVAVFVDGGRWHGRLDRRRPGRSAYWDSKIARNVARDRRHDAELRRDGWTVLRFWDDEVLREPEAVVKTIQRSMLPLPVAEFFAGIGLVRAGLESAGFRVVLANDNNPTKFRIYADNFGSDDFLLADVRVLTGDDVPDVALAAASFPCTDLSLAGWRRGFEGTESSLFWHFARILEEMGERRPRVVSIENVSSFSSSKDGDDLRTAIEELNRLGYICDVLQLDARIWVPQSRPRMFIVGSLEQLTETTNWQASPIRPEWVGKFVARHPELRMQAAALPMPRQIRATLADVIDRTPPDSDLWWDDDRRQKFIDSLSTLQSARLDALRERPTVTWRTAYRRTRRGLPTWEIRPDEISGCLRTARGGSSRQAVVEAGVGAVRIRWMTSDEYARLMGADEFILSGVTEIQALFGLGDAVCVPAVGWLAREYLSPLAHGELTAGTRTDPTPNSALP